MSQTQLIPSGSRHSPDPTITKAGTFDIVMATKAFRWMVIVLAGLALVLGGIYYYAAYGLPFATDVAVGGASLLEPDRLLIWLGCGDGASASATATEDETTVTIHARLQTRPGDCATSAEVQLGDPLGERILIDGYDGTEIRIDGLTSSPFPIITINLT